MRCAAIDEHLSPPSIGDLEKVADDAWGRRQDLRGEGEGREGNNDLGRTGGDGPLYLAEYPLFISPIPPSFCYAAFLMNT